MSGASSSLNQQQQQQQPGMPSAVGGGFSNVGQQQHGWGQQQQQQQQQQGLPDSVFSELERARTSLAQLDKAIKESASPTHQQQQVPLLPRGWVRQWDMQTQRYCYIDTNSNPPVVQWEPPTYAQVLIICFVLHMCEFCTLFDTHLGPRLISAAPGSAAGNLWKRRRILGGSIKSVWGSSGVSGKAATATTTATTAGCQPASLLFSPGLQLDPSQRLSLLDLNGKRTRLCHRWSVGHAMRTACCING